MHLLCECAYYAVCTISVSIDVQEDRLQVSLEKVPVMFTCVYMCPYLLVTTFPNRSRMNRMFHELVHLCVCIYIYIYIYAQGCTHAYKLPVPYMHLEMTDTYSAAFQLNS
jgi:hypothetical protein